MKNYKKWRKELNISQVRLGFETKIPRHRIQMAEKELLKLNKHELELVFSFLNSYELKRQEEYRTNFSGAYKKELDHEL